MHTVLTSFITWLKVLLKVLVLIIAIFFSRSYWYWYWQYFFRLVLVLNIAILFTSIVNNPGCRYVACLVSLSFLFPNQFCELISSTLCIITTFPTSPRYSSSNYAYRWNFVIIKNELCSFISARQHICYSALYAIARPSVRLSVCPSHGWISQIRLKLGSRNLHHRVAPWL